MQTPDFGGPWRFMGNYNLYYFRNKLECHPVKCADVRSGRLLLVTKFYLVVKSDVAHARISSVCHPLLKRHKLFIILRLVIQLIPFPSSSTHTLTLSSSSIIPLHFPFSPSLTIAVTNFCSFIAFQPLPSTI